MQILGYPKNIGELRDMIKDYPDNTRFEFLNQHEQVLLEYEADDETIVVFQEL